MSIDLVIWFAGAGLASVFLLKMMRSKQAKLSNLLREYLKEKLEWARKRAKAVKIARKTAAEQAYKEKAAAQVLKDMVSNQPQREEAA